MGTGYTRNDTSNNIANNKVADADDIDGEFNAVEDAFNSSTGHTHDGTAAEGGPVSVVGPAQEYVADGTSFSPKTDDTYDLGTASLKWKDLYIDGTANLDAISGGAIGSDVQAWDAGLDDIAALAVTDGNIIVGDGANWVAESGATARTSLGVAIGSDVQAYSADLDTYVSNPLAATELVELQNIGTTTISAAQWGYLGATTAFAGTLLDDADAATARATLGIDTGDAVEFGDLTITGDVTINTNDLVISESGNTVNIGDSTLYVDITNGRVGIGETSPGYPLHITKPVPTIRLEDSDTSAYGFIFSNNQGSLVFQADEGDSAASSIIRFDVDGTEGMRMDDSQNLGIGNTPQRRLDVNSTEFTVASFRRSGSANAAISLVDSGTTNDTQVAVGATGDDMLLYAGGSAEVYIMDGGNVGISQSSPNTILHANGALTLDKTAEPTDPDANDCVIWMSNGTGAGDDGDLMVKINIGSTVKTATLADYSAL